MVICGIKYLAWASAKDAMNPVTTVILLHPRAAMFETPHKIIQKIIPIVLMLSVTACAQQPFKESPKSTELGRMLTLEAIFKDFTFDSKKPGQIRWLKDGSGYTALETVEQYRDAEPERDEEGEIIKWAEDIVIYDPATLDREVLISADQLTPDGEEKALTVDDYIWSEDRSKLLVYTNSVKVWRSKSRGDYWMLDVSSDDLWQLGGDEAVESTLQFAKFSPDGNRVAYVREDNIYVQDLQSREIAQLTSDASDTIINGLIDWVYEE